jgi:hypothetical protein
VNTGDLEPDWVVDITAESGTDFSAVQSWRFWAYRETTDGKVEVFDDTSPGHTAGATPNVVALSHAWDSGETATAGVLHAVPIAVWPGGREQSFPGASIVIQTDGT